jgi:hypothetical protein
MLLSGGQKPNVAQQNGGACFAIPAAGWQTEGNQITTTQRLQVVRSETKGADITELVHGFTLHRAVVTLILHRAVVTPTLHRAVVTLTLHRVVITLTPATKVRNSLRSFSRNSHIVVNIKCGSAVPYFTQMVQ